MIIKNLILLLLALIFTGCSFFQPKLPPEKIKSETEEVIKVIQSKPDWLNENDICPKDVIPLIEKPVTYLDEGCENNAQKCLEQCKNEDANACYSLALLIQKRIDLKKEEANPLFLRACKFGIISGCTNIAAARFNIDDTDSETVKCSIDTFEKTCERDEPWGCTMFGMVLTHGTGRPQDLDKALKVLSKSCKYGDEDEACKSAKSIEQQITDFKKSKKNDSNTNSKNRTR
jgi:TPR repeat protein